MVLRTDAFSHGGVSFGGSAPRMGNLHMVSPSHTSSSGGSSSIFGGNFLKNIIDPFGLIDFGKDQVNKVTDLPSHAIDTAADTADHVADAAADTADHVADAASDAAAAAANAAGNALQMPLMIGAAGLVLVLLMK